MIRPSPTESATLYKVNTKRKGNDGNIWIIVENANGVKRWKLYKKPTNKPSKKTSKKTSKKPSKKSSKKLSKKPSKKLSKKPSKKLSKKSSKKLSKKPSKKSSKKPSKKLSDKALKKNEHDEATDGEIVNFDKFVKNQLAKYDKFDIIVTEPTIGFDGLGGLGGNFKKGKVFSDFFGGDIPKINATMYKKMTKPPKSFRDNISSNAYTFGKIYGKKSYKKVSGFMNDIAQVGIVDVTGITEQEYADITKRLEKYGPSLEKKSDYNWDDPKLLDDYRKFVTPRILFIGSTDGGDVGADIYAHFDKADNIDSIVIDNDYLFREKGDDEGDDEEYY